MGLASPYVSRVAIDEKSLVRALVRKFCVVRDVRARASGGYEWRGASGRNTVNTDCRGIVFVCPPSANAARGREYANTLSL